MPSFFLGHPIGNLYGGHDLEALGGVGASKVSADRVTKLFAGRFQSQKVAALKGHLLHLG
jgi:hypothetical protein